QEALEVFDECAMGLQLGLKASLNLSLPAQERENVGRWPLAEVVEEAHQSATLFGRNVATWNVSIVDGPVLEGDVAVWRLLLIALALDPLERLKAANRRGAVSVRFEGGLVIEDDGPDGPIPWAAHVAADRLAVSVSRERGRTVVGL
ncbi:MAG: hypothetical protein GY913_01000, partial [Proteobacteria bacterium]|nr:hypothetical protein [Pseudomonadota bacterium]